MALEIEKKFLLAENGSIFAFPTFFRRFPTVGHLHSAALEEGERIRQGYVSPKDSYTLRLLLGMRVGFAPVESRLRERAGSFFFTVKGDGGVSRLEEECQLEERLFAEHWAKTAGRRVEKIRLSLPYDGVIAEYDVYTNRDLTVAEVEVSSIKAVRCVVPLGKDISDLVAYKNRNLAC